MTYPAIIGLLLSSSAISGLILSKWLSTKSGYNAGANFWLRLLPTLAVLGFNFSIFSNLASTRQFSGEFIGIKGFFSFQELILLMIIGGLYATRAGQFLATLCTILILLRAGVRFSYSSHGIGVTLLIVYSALVMVLGDYLPWLPQNQRTRKRSNVLRSLLLVGICIGAIAFNLVTLNRLSSFSQWLMHLGIKGTSPTIIGVTLYSFLIGWTMIALGVQRQMMLFILALPSILLLAFITGWVGPLLAGPLATTLALAISNLELRPDQRTIEQNGALTMILYRNY